MFSFLKQDLKILTSCLSVEGNTEDMWNKPTLSRELSYALLSEKTDLYLKNFFIHLPHLLVKSFFGVKVKLKILSLFLSLEDNTEYMSENQH